MKLKPLLESEIPNILKDGDLGNLYDKLGEDHPFIHWNLEFMHGNLREASKKFEKLFPNITSKTHHYSEVYRGLCIKKRGKLYPEMSKLKVGDTFTINHKLYSSWTWEEQVAEQYSTQDESFGNYLSLRLSAKTSKLKIFTNLYEIGDMCEEFIIYPGIHKFKVTKLTHEDLNEYKDSKIIVVYAELL